MFFCKLPDREKRTAMKNIGLIITIMAVSFQLFAQEQFKHEKKMYKAPDGKLYVNKKLPVYLWISTSSDPNSQKVKLESEDSKAFVNPFFFDTEGYNSIRTPSKVDTITKKVIVPLEDIIWEVYADSYTPTTTITYNNSTIYRSNKRLYSSGNLVVSFKSEDVMSGVEKIFYSIDGTPFQEYKDSLTFDQEKEYTIKFYAVDNVGNAEETNTRIFSIDKTTPETKIEFEGDNSETVVSSRSKIKVVSVDNGSGVKKTMVSIDNAPVFTYSTPIAANFYKEGEHTITYYSVDNLGNTETTKSLTFFIDKTAPILIDEILGDSYFVNGKEYMSGRTQLKLTAIDNKAGVKTIMYSSDTKGYEEYKGPIYLPSNKDGLISVNFFALDKVNNKSQSGGSSSKYHNTYVDLRGPRIGYRYTGATFRNRDTTFINPQTKIALYGSDDESGMKQLLYSVNSGKEEEYTKPFSLENEGKYSITYRGLDNVNNNSSANFWFVVDKTGPDIFERYSIESIGQKSGFDLYPSHTVVFLSATDKDSGFERLQVSINNGPYAPYTGYINKLAKNTKYKIKVKAFDKLGNFKDKTFEFATGD